MATVSILRADTNPLYLGFKWEQNIVVTRTDDVAVFPAGITITAQVRETVDNATVLSTLTSGGGHLTRIDDDTLTIEIPDTESSGWSITNDSVLLDLVRTDTTPDEHMGIRLVVPVVQSVTRGY